MYINNINHILINPYVQAILIVLGFFVGAKILVWLAQGVIKKMAKKTKTQFDDFIVAKIKTPFVYFLVLVGLDFALTPLNLASSLVDRLVESIVVLGIMYIIKEFTDVLLEVWSLEFAKKTKSKLDDSLLPLFQKFAKVLFFIIAVIWILKKWGVDVAPLLASMGVAGVVLGFALKDSLGNIFGGISVILDRNLELGDKIQLESGEVGLVLDIGLRSTKIKTFDNELLIVPNGKIANSMIHNFAKPDINNRVAIEFTAEYGSNIREVKKVAMEIIEKMRGIEKKPKPEVLFTEMGDYSLNFKALFWVDDYNKVYSKKFEFLEKAYNRFNKNKIGIPFPTQTVYVKKEE